MLDEMAAFGDIERRRVFHLAYERRHAMEILDPLVAHAREPLPPSLRLPTFQAIFCIDEREESLRRHLEEVEPACETFGVPGFFGVAMHYRGLDDPHAMPLCPITVRPEHDVEEVVLDENRLGGLIRKQWRRTSGHAAHEWFERNAQPGSRDGARRIPGRPHRGPARAARALSPLGGATDPGRSHGRTRPDDAPHTGASRGRAARHGTHGRVHDGGDGGHRRPSRSANAASPWAGARSSSS